MATAMQKMAIGKLIENGGIVSRAMVDSGYSPATAHTPSKLTSSKAFRELAAEHGLTPEFLTKALVSDIKDKPKNRKPEMELGFKVLGIGNERPDTPPPTGNTYNSFIQQNVNIDPNAPAPRKLVENTLDILMDQTKRIKNENPNHD